MKLNRHRRSFVAAAALALLTAVCGGGFAAENLRETLPGSGVYPTQAGVAPAVEAKKKCRFVKKKVHGKVRKVRVCTKVKPKPAPSLPSKVSVTLDSAHAATAAVSADSGATLSAGAATLTVPPGAVAQATTVTMTPVSKLGGLKGQIVGAVQFKPDGLQFVKPVTLTIEVPSTSGLKAFTYAGNGTDFHLYPVKIAGGKATVDLIHFSGYGVGEGLPSPAVAKVRQFLTTVVKPQVAAAKSDSGQFAYAAFRTWELVLEMAALPTDDFVKLYPELLAVEADLGAALRKFADDEHMRCVETHDIVRTARDVEYARWLVFPLATLAGAQALGDALSYARQQASKCESFELDFESTMTYDYGPVGRDVVHVRVVHLKLNAANTWTNEAPLEYASITIHPGDCGAPATSSRPVAPFQAKLVASWDSWPPKLSMEISPGGALELLDWDCPSPVGHQHLETAYWSGGFLLLHGGPPLKIEDWNYLGGALYAEKTYRLTNTIVSELTTFVLRHTPT